MRTVVDGALVADAPAVDRIVEQVVQVGGTEFAARALCEPSLGELVGKLRERHDPRGVALEGEAHRRSCERVRHD